MACYVDNATARERWGEPCQIRLRRMRFCGRPITVHRGTLRAWRAMRRFLKKNYPNYVEKIASTPDTGAYNCRHIGNDPGRPWSGHAWAYCVDLRWGQNGYGVDPKKSEIWNEARGLIEWAERNGFCWGGRWSTPDPMHFEFNKTERWARDRWTWRGRRKQ